MPTFETNRRRIIKRLEAEGWVNRGGAGHDVFEHPSKPQHIPVPRHRVVSVGAARSIAKSAGWI